MLLGVHESVAGGIERAVERATARGGETLQVFTKNASQWREPALEKRTLEAFRAARLGWGGGPVISHASYLINLCSERDDVRRRSLDALLFEIERCEALGAAFIALHPGAAVGAQPWDAIARASDALGAVLERTQGYATRIAIENTAGQGSSIGASLEELGQLLKSTEGGEHLVVCIDTQHLFAAGYDLRNPAAYDSFWADFDRAVGIDRLACFHLNDSKRRLGERVDRHEAIGEGELGPYPFWRLVHDPRFADVPGVVELPEQEAEASLVRLRELRDAPVPPGPGRAVAPLELTPPQPRQRRR